MDSQDRTKEKLKERSQQVTDWGQKVFGSRTLSLKFIPQFIVVAHLSGRDRHLLHLRVLAPRGRRPLGRREHFGVRDFEPGARKEEFIRGRVVDTAFVSVGFRDELQLGRGAKDLKKLWVTHLHGVETTTTTLYYEKLWD